MKSSKEFRQEMINAGFSGGQMEFIEENLAQKDHEHVAEEIVGLENTVAELVEANLEDEDEEGEE